VVTVARRGAKPGYQYDRALRIIHGDEFDCSENRPISSAQRQIQDDFGCRQKLFDLIVFHVGRCGPERHVFVRKVVVKPFNAVSRFGRRRTLLTSVAPFGPEE
jgi:hypothetical protein